MTQTFALAPRTASSGWRAYDMGATGYFSESEGI